MSQFDAAIVEAGKPGASLEAASAAWEAHEKMTQETKKEEEATENDPKQAETVKAKVKQDIAVKQQKEKVEAQ